jgi:hypothetical protein
LVAAVLGASRDRLQREPRVGDSEETQNPHAYNASTKATANNPNALRGERGSDSNSFEPAGGTASSVDIEAGRGSTQGVAGRGSTQGVWKRPAASNGGSQRQRRGAKEPSAELRDFEQLVGLVHNRFCPENVGRGAAYDAWLRHGVFGPHRPEQLSVDARTFS